MTEEERLVAAGEYVLGTLDMSERAAFAARIASERASAEAVRWWERALATLADGASEALPPPRVWEAVRGRIASAAAANDPGSPVDGGGGIGPGWRVAAVALGALAASLLSFVIVRPAPRAPVAVPAAVQPMRASYIAALNAKGQESALLLTLDSATGAVVVHPVKLSAPARRSLELWWIGEGAAPRAVGLLDPVRPLRARVVAAKLDGGAFAVSVEPLGGSTTGAPTGPVVYSGAVVRATG